MPAYTNAKQTIPHVFKCVVENDREREALRDSFVAYGPNSPAQWLRLKELIADRKNLRIGAEKALRWNTDKGNTA